MCKIEYAYLFKPGTTYSYIFILLQNRIKNRPLFVFYQNIWPYNIFTYVLYIYIYYIQTDNIMPLWYCAHVYYSIFPGGKFTLNSVPLFSYTILNSCLHRGLLHHHHHPPSPLCMKAFYLPPFSSHGQIK